MNGTSHTQRRPRFRTMGYLFAVITLLAACAWAADNQTSDSEGMDMSMSVSTPKDDGQNVLREGTKVENVLGYFKVAGDRAEFESEDGKQRFGGLENLLLERVVHAASDNRDLLWSVSGTITEYQGQNFILVTYAKVKTQANEPASASGLTGRRSSGRRP